MLDIERIRYMKMRSHKTYAQIATELNTTVEEIKKAYQPKFKERELNLKEEEPVENKPPKTLQLEIFRRFMSEEEFALLLAKYRENSKQKGSSFRRVTLAQPIKATQLELLKMYVTDFSIPLKDCAREKGLSLSIFYTTVLRTATKVIAQHPEILDKVEVQEDSEE